MYTTSALMALRASIKLRGWRQPTLAAASLVGSHSAGTNFLIVSRMKKPPSVGRRWRERSLRRYLVRQRWKESERESPLRTCTTGLASRRKVDREGFRV